MKQITGNTYPVKDQLKALGGKWLVNSAPKTVPSYNSYNPRKCRVCGVVQTFNARGFPNVKIYKSGECQDCYEERKMGY